MESIPQVTVNNTTPTSIDFNVEEFISSVLNYRNINSGFFEFSFISNAEIHKINKEHLNHDYETDVITFNLSENDNHIVGDSYISIDQAKVQSKEYNQSLSDELKLLIIHSILHLEGYEDYTNEDKEIMNSLQTQILEELR